jgi:site-specific recombinase XerD
MPLPCPLRVRRGPPEPSRAILAHELRAESTLRDAKKASRVVFYPTLEPTTYTASQCVCGRGAMLETCRYRASYSRAGMALLPSSWYRVSMTHDNGANALSADDVVEEYRRELERQCKPLHTVRAYVGDVRSFRAHFEREGGSLFPGGVRSEDVRGYLSALNAKPATLHRRRAGLSSFFRWAVSANHCSESPVEGLDAVRLAPLRPTQRRALGVKEKKRFLATVKEHGTLRDQAVCELLLATAIREDELVHMRLEDMELGEHSGSVRVQGKGSRKRTIPLHRGVRRALSSWLAARPVLGPFLFPGRYGGALATSSIRRLVDKYERLSGVAGVTPHVLRHTTLTELARHKRDDIALVAAYAGHAKPATTAFYLQLTQQDLEAAANSRLED